MFSATPVTDETKGNGHFRISFSFNEVCFLALFRDSALTSYLEERNAKGRQDIWYGNAQVLVFEGLNMNNYGRVFVWRVYIFIKGFILCIRL